MYELNNSINISNLNDITVPNSMNIDINRIINDICIQKDNIITHSHIFYIQLIIGMFICKIIKRIISIVTHYKYNDIIIQSEYVKVPKFLSNIFTFLFGDDTLFFRIELFKDIYDILDIILVVRIFNVFILTFKDFKLLF